MDAAGWQEMYVWPFAPHDRQIAGLTADAREILCSFHPIRQGWVDHDGNEVTITHWREIAAK